MDNCLTKRAKTIQQTIIQFSSYKLIVNLGKGSHSKFYYMTIQHKVR
jgi:hypothetical protein